VKWVSSVWRHLVYAVVSWENMTDLLGYMLGLWANTVVMLEYTVVMSQERMERSENRMEMLESTWGC
jgi:hypothetical protein